MPLEARCRQTLTFCRQVNDPRPSINWARLAYHQPEFLKPIDCRCHRATGQAHLVLNLRDGERALVQEGFERGEIREAQPRVGDALLSQRGLARDKLFAITSQSRGAVMPKLFFILFS